ncbi:MAG: DNA-processing protein DprA [Dokdonella sp.]|uniref:DNA-processing protein DprA n=1 Tax=Dokdonella sp. TaxID=2291710 RepID=UPI00326368C6
MDIEAHRSTIEAWLILLRAPGLGPAAIRELVTRHGSAPAAVGVARRQAGHDGANAASASWLRSPDRTRIDEDLRWLAATDHTLLTFDRADDFPELLAEIPSAPAALFVAGDAAALWRPQISVVGSRNASHAGLANATAFARALASAGFAITSGLAEGIDGAAHEAALAVGATTIAVLGTGPDRVYPTSHRDLAARICAHGALVSEFPPGTPAQASHFPRRNRLIAGLGLGTLVVEASLRSGSLITARNAIDAGREVFAIPGSIHHPLSRGCHELIRNGARLVESAEEVVAELAPLALRWGASVQQRLAPSEGVAAPAARPKRSNRIDDPDYRALFDALDHDAVGIDQLSRRSGLDVSALSSMLLMLELEGDVVATPGGGYARRIEPR